MSAASDEPRRPTIAPRLPGHATAGGARSSRRPRATRASDSRLRRRTMRLLLVAVALDYADRGMLGGVAPSVRADFHVSNTQLGLAAAIFSLVGGIATLPAGVLTDRVRRTRLLGVSVMAWSVAMAASGG